MINDGPTLGNRSKRTPYAARSIDTARPHTPGSQYHMDYAPQYAGPTFGNRDREDLRSERASGEFGRALADYTTGARAARNDQGRTALSSSGDWISGRGLRGNKRRTSVNHHEPIWIKIAPLITALVASTAIGTYAARELLYDNTLPIANIRQKVLTPLVSSKERVFLYSVVYSKRSDCKGVAGHYRIRGETDSGDKITIDPFRIRTEGKWPVGKNQTASPKIHIPISVPDGVYDMWWHWCYKCTKATRRLCVTSPSMKFRLR